MKFIFTLFTALIFWFDSRAQTTYAISGSVKNNKGEKLQSATVFIAGTQKITASNAEGQFSFSGVNAGNYIVVVNMLGYSPVTQAVVVKDHSEIIDLTLTDKVIPLAEVVIHDKKQSAKDLKRFEQIFLGFGNDPKLCRILNPEIINFSHTDSTLTASTDDFLVIENLALGYRVKYLLKSFFRRNSGDGHFFDGDYTFEPLTGTAEQQEQWNTNRKKAYEGSRMHFFRTLYTRTTRDEGFLIYRITTDNALTIERNPSDPQQYVNHADSNFISVKIEPRIMVVYDKQKAAQPDIINDKPPKKYVILLGLPQNFTLVRLTANIDSRGSITDFTRYNFFGYWPTLGVSKQLPFEYQPD